MIFSRRLIAIGSSNFTTHSKYHSLHILHVNEYIRALTLLKLEYEFGVILVELRIYSFMIPRSLILCSCSFVTVALIIKLRFNLQINFCESNGHEMIIYFQDEQSLYLIMEYVPGGDMMQLLINKGLFDEKLAR